MDLILEDDAEEMLMVASPSVTLAQVARVLQQRHASLRDRSLLFKVTNTLKVGCLMVPQLHGCSSCSI